MELKNVAENIGFTAKELKDAKKEMLDDYELSGNGIGIHWDNLDEDLYVPNLLLGITDINRLNKPA